MTFFALDETSEILILLSDKFFISVSYRDRGDFVSLQFILSYYHFFGLLARFACLIYVYLLNIF